MVQKVEWEEILNDVTYFMQQEHILEKGVIFRNEINKKYCQDKSTFHAFFAWQTRGQPARNRCFAVSVHMLLVTEWTVTCDQQEEKNKSEYSWTSEMNGL